MKESTKKILAMPRTMTVSDVAKELGLTYNQVASVSRTYAAGFAKKNQGRRSDFKRMYQLIESGESYSKIGKVMGIKPQTIYHHARKIGVKRAKIWDEEKIVSMYKSGKQIKSIEAFVGCANSVVYRVLRDHGIELNRR